MGRKTQSERSYNGKFAKVFFSILVKKKKKDEVCNRGPETVVLNKHTYV